MNEKLYNTERNLEDPVEYLARPTYLRPLPVVLSTASGQLVLNKREEFESRRLTRVTIVVVREGK